jgi:hypothetical protein
MSEVVELPTAKHSRRCRKLVPVVVVLLAYGVGTIVAHQRGYRFGRNVVVRCREGHLFTTIWIPGVSVKALRLGWTRLQRCPIGRHWTLVKPVLEAELDPSELALARQHHDVLIP